MISRIHTYAALLSLASAILYAMVGIAALWDSRAAPAPVVREQAFTRPPGESDRATAQRVVILLGLSLATPVHDFNIRRDAGRLVLDFYHVNGRDKITLLDDRIRIEHTRAGLFRYLSTLHVTTAAFHSGDARLQVWAWWNEFTMWCLGAMTVSGVWMWFQRRAAKGAARRVHRWTAVAMGAVIVIYELSAIQMAHRTWPKAALWLERVHRMRGLSFAPVLGIGLILLAVTGLYLWWRGRTATWLLAAGCSITCILVIWMRVASA